MSWEDRFRAALVSLPRWARDAPHRCVYRSNASGTFEQYAWDRSAGTHRQATGRPNGTSMGTVDPAGEWLWWFADTDGDEFGVWLRQPFDGGPDEPALPGLPASYPAGLHIGRTLTAVGRATDDGASIHLRAGGETRTVYAHEQDAHLVGMSRDETLLCLSHSEHGDSTKPALRVLRIGGEAVADLWDGPGLGIDGVAFSPVAGDPRVLALHERDGRRLPLLWDPVSGTDERISLDLPGEVSAGWYAEGSALLVTHSFRARGDLYRYDLTTRQLTALGTPSGTVLAATARPDATVEFTWSSAMEPIALRDVSGGVVLRPESTSNWVIVGVWYGEGACPARRILVAKARFNPSRKAPSWLSRYGTVRVAGSGCGSARRMRA